MNAKNKRAGDGVELAVITALVFLGLDSKLGIPVGKNFCIVAWINRDRANIQYFRRRRIGKGRRREQNERDHKIGFSNSRSRNHPHKFHLSSSSAQFSNRYA